MGVGGQMAVLPRLQRPATWSAASPPSALCRRQPKDNVPSQRLAFFLAGGELDPLVKGIAESRGRSCWRRSTRSSTARSPSGAASIWKSRTSRELVRWIDSLDRL